MTESDTANGRASAIGILAGMDEEEFLTGDAERETDIDDIFGKDWEEMLADARRDEPESLTPVGPSWPADADDRYRLQEIEGGILLLSPEGDPVGGYVGVDVSIAFEHQGQGLGKEIVLARFVRFGDLPTWHLDDASYSRAGEAAHRAAWRLGRSRPDLVALLETRGGDAPEQGVSEEEIAPVQAFGR